MTGIRLGHGLLVRELIGLKLLDGSLLVRWGKGIDTGAGFLVIDLLIDLEMMFILILILYDGVVGDGGELGISVNSAREEQRALDDHPPFDGGIPLDHAGVEKRNKEDGREKGDTTTSAHSDSGDVPGGLLAQTQVGGALVDDGKGTDGGGDQKEERRTPDGPGDGVSPHVHDKLDKHKDDSGKATRSDWGHAQTSEDGTETLAIVPAPLNLGSASRCNSNTSNGRDERVGGRNVGRVTSAPHHPGGCSGKGTGEGKHLDTGIVAEGCVGDNAVFDGISGTGTDCDGAEELEDGTEDHSLAVGDGSRGNTGSPRIGNIVFGGSMVS